MNARRRAAAREGCNVARVLVGTEGTCVVVLEATTRLIHSPPVRALLVLGYPDVFRAAEAVPEVLRYGGHRAGKTRRAARGSRLAARRVRRGHQGRGRRAGPPPDGGAASERRRAGHGARDDADAEDRFWLVREAGLGATASVPGGPHLGRLGGRGRGPRPPGGLPPRLQGAADRYDHSTAALYGHFGDGCVHTRIDFDLHTPKGIAASRRFIEEAADLVLSYGGSLSGEHRDGESRGELLPRMFGEELQAEPLSSRRSGTPVAR